MRERLLAVVAAAASVPAAAAADPAPEPLPCQPDTGLFRVTLVPAATARPAMGGETVRVWFERAWCHG